MNILEAQEKAEELVGDGVYVSTEVQINRHSTGTREVRCLIYTKETKCITANNFDDAFAAFSAALVKGATQKDFTGTEGDNQ